jgi:LGFP repeat-containing protein
MTTIEQKYSEITRVQGPLGLPIEEEQVCADEIGRVRRFERGAVYSHPEAGVHPVFGTILSKWLQLGGERSLLGYPTSDDLVGDDGLTHCSCFQKGRIYSSPEAGLVVTDLVSDRAVSQWIVFNAKPAPHDLLQNVAKVGPFTAVLDYSVDATFVRNQGRSTDAGYGCPTYTLLHVVDILKDWEHPYTPALSWHYAEWMAVRYIATHAAAPDLQFSANEGFASEALCHTDYEMEYQWGPPDAGGYPTAVWSEPSLAAKEEALLYRARIRSNDSFVMVPAGVMGVELVKGMLRTYGPIWSCGGGHAKAIVGYDDEKREFKILDSYPHEETGGHNLTTTSYDRVGLDAWSYDIAAVSEVYNWATPLRATGKHAYSARICVEGNWRGTYTVSLGVEGMTPLVVWTTRGRDTKAPPVPLEPSRFLRLDVPLPDYAASCWPPSAKHRWFLRVEDHDRDGSTGTISEFTLARRLLHPDCRSIGKYSTEAFGGSISAPVPDPTTGSAAPYPANGVKPNGEANPNPGVTTVYVPATASPAANTISATRPAYQPHYVVGLQYSDAPPTPRLHGFVNEYMLVGSELPTLNREVTLFRNVNTCVNKPSQWERVGVTVTDSDGLFTFAILPTLDKTEYYAAGLGSDPSQVVASSDYVEVTFRHGLPSMHDETGEQRKTPLTYVDLSQDPIA